MSFTLLNNIYKNLLNQCKLHAVIPLQINDLQRSTQQNYSYFILLICILIIVFLFLIWMYLDVKQKLTQLTKIHKEETLQKIKQQKEISITKAMLQGEEQERSRLAKELHDGMGASLSSIKLSLSTINSTLKNEELNHSINSLDTAINEMRRLSHSMMPNNIIKYGLRRSLEDFFIELQYNVPEKLIKFEYYGDWIRFSQGKELHIYRIINELINNALKHSEATEILTQIVSTDKELSLTIEDNGKGFDPLIKNGMGLENIKSRLNYLGGSIDIKSKNDKGASIFMIIPI